MLVVAVNAFFAGGYSQRSELSLSSQANLKQLQGKDQMIQSQEAQLAQTRQQLNDTSNQLAAMKTKLEAKPERTFTAKQRAECRRAANRSSDREPVSGREKNCIARDGHRWLDPSAGGGKTNSRSGCL